MTDINAVEGTSTDEVTTAQNATGASVATPIFEVDPDRGTFLRFLNRVAVGDSIGLPVYMDLRDSNDNPLPVNSALYWAVQPAGHDEDVKVSKKIESIDFWVNNSISEQRDRDKVDNAKMVLTHAETAAQSGPRSHLDVRDVDTLRLKADSSAQIDHSNSSIFVDASAVEQFGRR